MWDAGRVDLMWASFHAYVHQIITLSTLIILQVCQLYFDKAGGKNVKRNKKSELVDWVKQTALPSVGGRGGGLKIAGGLNRTKDGEREKSLSLPDWSVVSLGRRDINH